MLCRIPRVDHDTLDGVLCPSAFERNAADMDARSDNGAPAAFIISWMHARELCRSIVRQPRLYLSRLHL